MTARYCAALLLVCAVFASAQTFPTEPPRRRAQYATEEEKNAPPKPPESRPVANFGITPEARMRAVLVAGAGAGAFLLVFVIALFSARASVVPASLAASLFGPALAIAMNIRHLPGMLMKTRDAPTLLAGLSLDLWNLNQPLLFALYATVGCLLILTVTAGVTRSATPPSTAVTILPLVIVAAATIAFDLEMFVNRAIIAVADPFPADAFVRQFRFTSLAETSQTIARSILAAFAVSLTNIGLIAAMIALAFALRRRMHGAIWIVLLVLVTAGAAAFVEHSWCELLEATARTGRIPA